MQGGRGPGPFVESSQGITKTGQELSLVSMFVWMAVCSLVWMAVCSLVWIPCSLGILSQEAATPLAGLPPTAVSLYHAAVANYTTPSLYSLVIITVTTLTLIMTTLIILKTGSPGDILVETRNTKKCIFHLEHCV